MMLLDSTILILIPTTLSLNTHFFPLYLHYLIQRFKLRLLITWHTLINLSLSPLNIQTEGKFIYISTILPILTSHYYRILTVSILDLTGSTPCDLYQVMSPELHWPLAYDAVAQDSYTCTSLYSDPEFKTETHTSHSFAPHLFTITTSHVPITLQTQLARIIHQHPSSSTWAQTRWTVCIGNKCSLPRLWSRQYKQHAISLVAQQSDQCVKVFLLIWMTPS